MIDMPIIDMMIEGAGRLLIAGPTLPQVRNEAPTYGRARRR